MMIRSIIRNIVRQKLKRYEYNRKDILLELQRRALIQTAKFVEENMLDMNCYSSKWDLLEWAVNKSSLDGLFLEFGVFKGTTINFIAKTIQNNKKVYGFDSFEGLPEDWRVGNAIDGKVVYDRSSFKLPNKPKVEKNVELIEGWFNDTLPEFVKNINTHISFLHIDCDLYSSTKTVFDFLSKYIVPGTIIVFDEFFNYHGWNQKGEYKAFTEFVNKNNVEFNYIGFCYNDEQVAVKILNLD